MFSLFYSLSFPSFSVLIFINFNLKENFLWHVLNSHFPSFSLLTHFCSLSPLYCSPTSNFSIITSEMMRKLLLMLCWWRWKWKFGGRWLGCRHVQLLFVGLWAVHWAVNLFGLLLLLLLVFYSYQRQQDTEWIVSSSGYTQWPAADRIVRVSFTILPVLCGPKARKSQNTPYIRWSFVGKRKKSVMKENGIKRTTLNP